MLQKEAVRLCNVCLNAQSMCYHVNDDVKEQKIRWVKTSLIKQFCIVGLRRMS